MSVMFDALEKLDMKDGNATPPWAPAKGSANGGVLSFTLPREILSDFYDLREYIRIASMRNPLRVLSITSSVPGEGSSTITTVLAFLMANGLEKKVEKVIEEVAPQAAAEEETAEKDPAAEEIFQPEFSAFLEPDSQKVEESASSPEGGILLIDANLHTPSLHKYFGLEVEDGLADIIEKRADWRKVAKQVHQSDLKIITAGRVYNNPANLIGSDVFSDLLAEWRQVFRCVIIDSPSVLNYVDALTLAAMADGVILVVRAGNTRWEIAQNAKRKLVMAHANLLGVTLNRHKFSIPDNYYQPLV
jgi:capsular exopolysaccharide synthesis family protein